MDKIISITIRELVNSCDRYQNYINFNNVKTGKILGFPVKSDPNNSDSIIIYDNDIKNIISFLQDNN